MHSAPAVGEAMTLRAQGLGARRIAARMGLPVSTVRDWLAGRVPRTFQGPDPCSHEFAALAGSYAYLLGLYLGDGCLSLHPRGVYKLRIALDLRYPRIIASASQAMEEIKGGHVAVQRRLHENCVDVHAYWKCWPCLFPQHGPGPKHKRAIELTDWQQQIADRWPKQIADRWPKHLLRGLIHSDGCRLIKPAPSGSVPVIPSATLRPTSSASFATRATYSISSTRLPAAGSSTSHAKLMSPSSTPSSALSISRVAVDELTQPLLPLPHYRRPVRKQQMVEVQVQKPAK